MKYLFKLLIFLLFLAVTSCSPTKYVGKDQYLLNKVTIVTDNKSVKSGELKPYVRQQPNHKTFGLFRIPLSFYNLSGRDTTRWFNRWLRKIGNPPVIYDEGLTIRSESEIAKALSNRGYIHASVKADTTIKKKKINVRYDVTTNQPYYLNEITYNIPNDTLSRLILADTTSLLLKKGILFDRNTLEEERQRISAYLRNRGYYAFNKEYITYVADTAVGDSRVNIELNLMPVPEQLPDGETVYKEHEPYRIRNVYFITDYDPMSIDQSSRYVVKDTVEYKGYYILYGDKKFLRKETLVNNCYILPGGLFRNRALDNTYSAFSRLRILKYVNIRFNPVVVDGEKMLDCMILLTEGKANTASVDLEGTNSAGDLGVALGLTYQQRNLFRGSETFTAKFRGAYESLSGDLGGIINDNYSELGGELGITYPQFLFPFLKASFRKKLRATTEFAINLNFQQRPEYTRIIAGGGWRYKWNSHNNVFRHHLDLIDINYVYLPKTSDGFLDNIAPDNPLLRYSYENHFIMRTAYMFYRTNLNPARKGKDIYTLRAAAEMGGNLLYAISKLTDQKPGQYGEYSFLGIRYAQYAKADVDYAYTFLLDDRNSLALHVGAGIAVPYGNSEILPFEKRYFSGGANSVRGWSVRTLGPGTYRGTNPVSDFMNQCGDIRLDMNVEYRARLFWKLQLAAFIDAGNIWTIKEYSSQPGGVFKVKSFYKEIALSYGLGVRLDFNYFLLRLDMGVKAYDPSLTGKERWVISHQKFLKETVLHFAVGYPF